MKYIRNILIITLLFHSFAPGVFGLNYENSVVSIRVTTQEFDYYSPWERKRHKTEWIHGCVLDTTRGLIATLSLPLENHIYIEVSKHGEQTRYPATVILKDYETGIAFIAVPYQEFYADLEAVKLPENRTEPAKGVVVKWDTRGRFKSYPTESFATSIQSYEGLGGALIHQLITGLDSGGKGEPVFQGDYLVGITAWFDSNEKTIKANSSETIKWMLSESENGSYRGQPVFWLDTHYISGDENLKKYLGMKPAETGMLVSGIPPKGSGFGIIRKNDVILAIDGIDIDDNGLCDVPIYGKLNFMWIVLFNHFVGDTLELDIIRDREKKRISFPLLPETDDTILIPSYYRDTAPSYYIIGGLLFQELTRGYMNVWGADWESKADKRLAFYTKNYWIYPTEEQKRIVILNRVLPATLNQGYHNLTNLILLRINKTRVRDIYHARELIENSGDEFIVCEFAGNENIVLRRNSLIPETQTILKQYGIVAQHNLQ
ncbi:MAG: hypothetical protein JXJ04_24245 [Spirochaetales bacterium]|nr:hypothetical protein [Spirochaetales bacterium]